MTFEIGRAFEAVLQQAGAVDIHVDEESEAVSFRIDGRRFEAVDKRGHWMVTTSVGALDTDPARLDDIYAALQKANAELPEDARPALLTERDCYLWVEAKGALDWLNGDLPQRPARLSRLLEGTRKLADHALVSRVRGEFGQ